MKSVLNDSNRLTNKTRITTKEWLRGYSKYVICGQLANNKNFFYHTYAVFAIMFKDTTLNFPFRKEIS
jgi:hypothetical protein